MADRKATLTAVLVDSVSGPARGIKAEIAGIGETAGRVGSVLQGIGQGIGQALFSTFERGISAVADAIPRLLESGNAYLAQLHQIQLETGMTAEQTSTLVGVMKNLGVPTDALDVLFARLGTNLIKNEGLFRQLGVATRDSSNVTLGAYQIVENIRRAVQAHGVALLTTGAAQELFGKSAYKLLEYFQATDPEIAAATAQMQRWGGVVNQQAIDGAHAFERTLGSLGQGITDIGVQIASAVDPYLRSFVDAFAKFVQSHLNEIVNFAVGVVNVITGFVSGLFGITDALDVSTTAVDTHTSSVDKSAAAYQKWLDGITAGAHGEDAFSKSLNAQIKAIDAHSRALQAAADRRRAIEQRQRLDASLAAAQAQLADLRGNAPFTEGLSNAEQALALQKHAQDIIDAEKNVADQRQALGDFEADQKDRAETELLRRQKVRLQDNLAAHKATDAAILNSGLKMFGGLESGANKVLGNIGVKTAEFGATARTAFQTGVGAARSFLDILLGVESANPEGPLHGVASRHGGVVGAIGSLADALGKLGGVIGHVVDAIAWAVGVLEAIIGRLNEPIGPTHGEMSPKGGQPPLHASGGIFDTLGPTRIGNGIAGEAAGEKIAIVAHPRALGGGGGGTVEIHNHFDFLSMPSRDQLRKLVELVDEALYIKASNSPVGIQAFRGASG